MRTAAIAVMLSACALAQPALEQFLSAPFSNDLIVSGNRVAWVETHRGVRNVWTAEAPSWQGRKLTNYQDDDGQEIGQLAFAPDGIVYTRGGDIETFRDIPNPRSLPVGPEQAIWYAAFRGGEPRRIAEGSSAEVSPKGDRVLFSRGGQIYVTALDKDAKPAVLLYTKVRAGGLRFSPDGERVAFVSNRGDHSFVGVYSFAAKNVTYLDPSVDRDGEPAWSPDGKSIAFVRQAAMSRAFTFGPVREAEPWSIRVADAATGTGREVWRAEKGKGSAFHPVVGQTLIWRGTRLVFPWERDGWAHLYSIDVRDRSRATLLTPGEFEVEHVAAAADGAGVVFSSNQDDIDRRHVWKVAAGGGAAQRLTSGGIEWSPVSAQDGTVVFLRSNWKQPARAARLSGGEIRDIAPAVWPAESAAVEPKQVIFAGADGMPIHGQLFLPAGYDPAKKYPAIAFYHGGSRRQMLLGFHYMYYYANTYAMNQYLANRGYLVLSVNYRSGIGYGMEFREALNYGATGASEYQDVQGAGVYLRGRADVDGARIGLYGGSYGGYLTAMGLSRSSDLYAAGVDIHGVHDWNSGIRNFVPNYNPQQQQDAARLAFDSSPLASVKTWRSPVLLIHGDDDRNVNFNESVRLVEALRKQGVEAEQLVFPDDVHDFLTFENWMRAMTAAQEFLGRKLKAR